MPCGYLRWRVLRAGLPLSLGLEHRGLRALRLLILSLPRLRRACLLPGTLLARPDRKRGRLRGGACRGQPERGPALH